LIDFSPLAFLAYTSTTTFTLAWFLVSQRRHSARSFARVFCSREFGVRS
jgi:hypothetical protein